MASGEDAAALALPAMETLVDKYHDDAWERSKNLKKMAPGRIRKNRENGRESSYNNSANANERHTDNVGNEASGSTGTNNKVVTDSGDGNSKQQSLSPTSPRSERYPKDSQVKHRPGSSYGQDSAPRSKQATSPRRGTSVDLGLHKNPRRDRSPQRYRSSSAGRSTDKRTSRASGDTYRKSDAVAYDKPSRSSQDRSKRNEDSMQDNQRYVHRPPSPITIDDFRNNRRKA